MVASCDSDLNVDDRNGGERARSHASQTGKELPMPAIGDPELGALHIRVIALENLLIAMLAQASDQQIELARDMIRYIAPGEGFTPHPLTIHAAAHTNDLIVRSARFADDQLSRGRPVDPQASCVGRDASGS
jgi:hypothetical protein